MQTLALSNKLDRIADIGMIGVGALLTAMLLASVLIFSIGPRPPPAESVVVRDGKSERWDAGPRVVKVQRFVKPPEPKVMPQLPPPMPPPSRPDSSLWWPPPPSFTATPGWPKEQSSRAEAKEKPKPSAAEPRDICAKHGMRKVTVGKGWRCRK
jgi:hypothetical protein